MSRALSGLLKLDRRTHFFMRAFGIEWIVEAHGCRPDALRDVDALREMFESIVAGLMLTPVREAHWHRFPNSGGVTGMLMLSESHLTCHTFPEFASICLNVFSCKPRAAWNFDAELRRRLGASSVDVRSVERVYGTAQGGVAAAAFARAEE